MKYIYLKKPQSPLNWLTVIASVACALFGVQSEKNRVRDFQSGKPWHFIVIGLLMALLFVISLSLIVSWVLAH